VFHRLRLPIIWTDHAKKLWKTNQKSHTANNYNHQTTAMWKNIVEKNNKELNRKHSSFSKVCIQSLLSKRSSTYRD